MSEFDDIINMPHHISAKYPQMAMKDRAAQFAPFAALVGYESAVMETARITDSKTELGEYEIDILNRKLLMIAELSYIRPEITVTYFRPDELKAGGAYITESGCVKSVDRYERAILLTDGRRISIGDISDISGDIFGSADGDFL